MKKVWQKIMVLCLTIVLLVQVFPINAAMAEQGGLQDEIEPTPTPTPLDEPEQTPDITPTPTPSGGDSDLEPDENGTEETLDIGIQPLALPVGTAGESPANPATNQSQLSNALGKASAGDTIYVGGGGFKLTSTITITKDIAIVGPAGGIEIGINGNYRHFILSGTDRTVSFKNLIINGDTTDLTRTEGGGVTYDSNYSGSEIFMENCTIKNCRNYDSDGNPNEAIRADQNVEMNNCSITNNYIGIGATINITLIDCDVSGNAIEGVRSGYQTANAWGIVTATRCTFSNNGKELDGSMQHTAGAIFAHNLNIKDCIFNENTGYFGGAIYLTASSIRIASNIENCTFIKNKAANIYSYSSNDGGAVYITSRNDYSETIIRGCSFRDNTAERLGGAIYSNYATTKITDCTFVNNSASYGGAVYYGGEYPITIENSSFINNHAYDSFSNKGCSIQNNATNMGTAYITNCTFNNDTYSEDEQDIISGNPYIYIRGSIANKVTIANEMMDASLPSSDNDYNLIGSDYSYTFGPNTLADNGGSTQTIKIRPGSYAHNAIPGDVLSEWGITKDQRGVTRPQGPGGYADVGAVELQYPDEFYMVLFDLGNGEKPATVIPILGEKLEEPDDPAKLGHTFEGWYYKNEKWDFENDIVTEMYFDLIAKYTPNNYTVTFNSSGGSSVSEKTLTFNTLIPKPSDPARAGHTFAGWYNGSELWNFDIDTMGADNMTLTAHWTINSYTVLFDSAGGSYVTSQSVVYGEKATKPDDPTKEGYTFTGWYSGANAWDFDSNGVEKNITLVAKWKANSSGGTNSGNSSGSGSGTSPTSSPRPSPSPSTEPSPIPETTAKPTISPAPYTTSTHIPSTSPSSDSTLSSEESNAVGDNDEENNDEENSGGNGSERTVTYVAADGSETTIVIADGNKLIEPDAPIKEGYKFIGWYNGDEKWDFDNEIGDGDIVLTARFEEQDASGTDPSAIHGEWHGDGNSDEEPIAWYIYVLAAAIAAIVTILLAWRAKKQNNKGGN